MIPDASYIFDTFSMRRLVAYALIVLFTVVYVGLDISHEHHHALEHAHIHTDEEEQDGCHRAIYHGERGGCNHNTHISTSIIECTLCHIWTYHEYDVPVSYEVNIHPLSNHHIILLSFYEDHIKDIDTHSSASRGPPV